jgi:hypothetical protein
MEDSMKTPKLCCSGLVAFFVMICFLNLKRISLHTTFINSFGPMLANEDLKSEELGVPLEKLLLKQTKTHCSS